MTEISMKKKSIQNNQVQPGKLYLINNAIDVLFDTQHLRAIKAGAASSLPSPAALKCSDGPILVLVLNVHDGLVYKGRSTVAIEVLYKDRPIVFWNWSNCSDFFEVDR